MKIDKSVPPPRGSRITKYPFAHMEPGDSVFVPDEDTSGRAYRAAKTMGSRKGWTFTGRRQDGGIRIWRTV